MKPDNEFILDTWGEFACFTRPEMKVERFSYPVITPSAARGIYDAIYCKPVEFQWRITRIEILNPVKYIALRRNEVKEKISVSMINKYMEKSKAIEPIFADVTKDFAGTDAKGRTQRQTMALQNVYYRISAKIIPKKGQEYRLKAITEQAKRRFSAGKCFYQPYFGMREFPAYFEPYNPDIHKKKPLPVDMDLGFMLYDVFDLNGFNTENENVSISLFHAFVKNGILEVPEYENECVLKSR